MRGDDGGEGDKGDEASTGGGLLAVSLQQAVLTIAVNLQASQNLGTSTCFLSAHHDSGLAVSHRGRWKGYRVRDASIFPRSYLKYGGSRQNPWLRRLALRRLATLRVGTFLVMYKFVTGPCHGPIGESALHNSQTHNRNQ